MSSTSFAGALALIAACGSEATINVSFAPHYPWADVAHSKLPHSSARRWQAPLPSIAALRPTSAITGASLNDGGDNPAAFANQIDVLAHRHHVIAVALLRETWLQHPTRDAINVAMLQTIRCPVLVQARTHAAS